MTPRTAITVLVALLALGVRNTPAQQIAVCSSTPGTGERIECTEADTSSNTIELALKGIDIDTTGDNAPGVYGHHEGTGKIFIDLQTELDENGDLIRNDIDTTGDNAPGVYGRHVGSGNIEFGAQNAHITTAGNLSSGIHGHLGYRPGDTTPDDPPEAAGNIYVNISGSIIHTKGRNNAIYAEHYGDEGRVDIFVRSSTIAPDDGRGIMAWNYRGTGDVGLNVYGSHITTKTRSDYGITAQAEDGTHNIVIDVERGSVTTADYNGFGIRGYLKDSEGNVDIDVRGYQNPNGGHAWPWHRCLLCMEATATSTFSWRTSTSYRWESRATASVTGFKTEASTG